MLACRIKIRKTQVSVCTFISHTVTLSEEVGSGTVKELAPVAARGGRKEWRKFGEKYTGNRKVFKNFLKGFKKITKFLIIFNIKFIILMEKTQASERRKLKRRKHEWRKRRKFREKYTGNRKVFENFLEVFKKITKCLIIFNIKFIILTEKKTRTYEKTL